MIPFLCIFSGVRPFGVSLLVSGWDNDTKSPHLFQCDPSVSLTFHLISLFSFSMVFLFSPGNLLSLEGDRVGEEFCQWKNFPGEKVNPAFFLSKSVHVCSVRNFFF